MNEIQLGKALRQILREWSIEFVRNIKDRYLTKFRRGHNALKSVCRSRQT
jgi:hypothetical protein